MMLVRKLPIGLSANFSDSVDDGPADSVGRKVERWRVLESGFRKDCVS